MVVLVILVTSICSLAWLHCTCSINHPKIHHASTDIVVAAVNIDKGQICGGGLIWRPYSRLIKGC